MKVDIVSIDGMAFPEESPYRRDAPPNCDIIDSAFWDKYDYKTLFYMAIFDAKKEELTLFAPCFLNFQTIAMLARYSIDGIELQRPKYRKGFRFDCLIFHCITHSKHLNVEIDGLLKVIEITRTEPDLFAGTNLLYTLSRNNDLHWIRDWLEWHHKVHGANAVLFADNGSTAYSVEDLAATIASVPGYRRARIISAAFSHGPNLETAINSTNGKFLQTALMNALWQCYMSSARAMLNVDIDELVVSPDGTGIFDAVQSARWGIILAYGTWRYSMKTAKPYRHFDHFYKIENDFPCPSKYCLKPNTIAAKRILKVHNVKGFKRMPFVNRTAWHFLHCRGISTSWKYDRSQIETSMLVEDESTRNALLNAFEQFPTLLVP